MDQGTEWQLPVVLAGMPEVCAALLRCHVVDGKGRCAGCRTQTGPAVHWPCTLYRAAARARRIAADRPPGKGSPDRDQGADVARRSP